VEVGLSLRLPGAGERHRNGGEMGSLEDNATVETLLRDVEQLREGFGGETRLAVMSEDAFRITT
jgi:hypothetical protein